MPFQAFRAPVRFAFLMTVAVTWWAAAGAYAVWPRPAARWRRLALPVVWGLLWLESVPVGLIAAPVDPAWSATTVLAAGPVLTLPAPATEQQENATEVAWLHRAVATGQPVTGGVSGWVPPATRRLRERLAACEAGREDPRVLLDQLRAAGVVAAELAVRSAAPRQVAFWDSVLIAEHYRPHVSGPGYRRYEP